MKMASVVVGIVGIVVALIGLALGMTGAVIVRMFGQAHAPSTFLVVGILFLAISIWLAVIGLPEKKPAAE